MEEGEDDSQTEINYNDENDDDGLGSNVAQINDSLDQQEDQRDLEDVVSDVGGEQGELGGEQDEFFGEHGEFGGEQEQTGVKDVVEKAKKHVTMKESPNVK